MGTAFMTFLAARMIRVTRVIRGSVLQRNTLLTRSVLHVLLDPSYLTIMRNTTHVLKCITSMPIVDSCYGCPVPLTPPA